MPCAGKITDSKPTGLVGKLVKRLHERRASSSHRPSLVSRHQAQAMTVTHAASAPESPDLIADERLSSANSSARSTSESFPTTNAR